MTGIRSNSGSKGRLPVTNHSSEPSERSGISTRLILLRLLASPILQIGLMLMGILIIWHGGNWWVGRARTILDDLSANALFIVSCTVVILHMLVTFRVLRLLDWTVANLPGPLVLGSSLTQPSRSTGREPTSSSAVTGTHEHGLDVSAGHYL